MMDPNPETQADFNVQGLIQGIDKIEQFIVSKFGPNSLSGHLSLHPNMINMMKIGIERKLVEYKLKNEREAYRSQSPDSVKSKENQLWNLMLTNIKDFKD